MESALTRTLRRMLRTVPTSLRRLAQEAKVPHNTLAMIARGELGASPMVARAVIRALGRWGRWCLRSAERLERALRKGK